MKNILIIMWIVTGIIALAVLYVTNSTDCLVVLGFQFFTTIFYMLFN